MAPDKPGFLEELKQRHVVRAAIIYAAAVWALAQGISQLSPAFDLSTGVTFWFVIACVIGFPFWIAFAWYFKFTAHGIEREDEATVDAAALRRTGRHLDYWIIGILAVAVVLLLTNQLVLQRGKTLREFAAAPTPAAKAAVQTLAAATSSRVASMASPLAAQPIPAKSVAVLPFENLSADKSNAYFADGMQDLILTKLADIGDLKVIARTSTQSYRSHPENLTLVGKQLGVATILEGSVQKAGNQVLINVQLIDAKTDSHIWAESYTRTLDNIFGVEGEVADKVAKALNAKLTAAETVRVNDIPTTNRAAYDAYLQGEYYRLHDAIPHNLRTAAGWYRKAVAQDPKFALAWARLSWVLSWMARDPYNANNVKQALAAAAPAKAALDRALALAPDSPDIQLAKGWYLDYVKKDQAAAQVAFEAVLATQPNNAQAWVALGSVYVHRGQWQQALGYCEKAATLAPRDKDILNEVTQAYMALRRYPEAVQVANRMVASDPSAVNAILDLANAYSMEGDLTGAQAAFAAAPASVRDNPYTIFMEAQLKMRQRDFAGARKLLASLQPGGAGLPLYMLEGWRGMNERYAGNVTQAHQHFLRAEAAAKADLASNPEDAQSDRFFLGMLYAALGQSREVSQQIRLAEREQTAHASFDPYQTKVTTLLTKATAQAVLGNAGAAIPLLDQLLSMPAGAYISVPDLRLNPLWDPIRHDPAFQALLKKYSKDAPATTYPAPPAAAAMQ